MSNPHPVYARSRQQGAEEGGLVSDVERVSAEAGALSSCRLSDVELDLVPGGWSDEAGAVGCHWPSC